jgi:putative ABC transport system ATP-binding protein
MRACRYPKHRCRKPGTGRGYPAAGPVAEPALAAGALVLAAGQHHHLIKLLGLAAIVVVAVILAGWAIVALVRRRRRRTPPPAAPPPAGQAPAGQAPAGPREAPQSGASSPAVTAEHLTKTYRLGKVEVRALDDVTLEIGAGAMVCIMGKSGSGKSTLLRQLGLIDLPSRGRIWLHGQEVTGLPEHERTDLRLRRLGYVFQEYALLPELTAAENVYLPAMMAGQPARAYRHRAADLLSLVDLAPRAAHRPKELSGGEQQRVAIARALVNEPAIIYADEPTANLDTRSAQTVMQTLQRLNRTLGVTVVFVSHDPDDAQYASHLIHLSDGRLTDSAPGDGRPTEGAPGDGTAGDGTLTEDTPTEDTPGDGTPGGEQP